MVNTRSGPDERDLEILAALRTADGPVSGQALADGFGISRVALWKRIERLKGFAYRIEGFGRGYRLIEEDAVVAEAFQDGSPVVYRSETGSTMDEAWQLAEDGAPSGTFVIAEKQSAGRGRQGRAWQSPGGGLYLTLILRAKLPASHAACLAIEGACALADWLEAKHGCTLDFHWPNDLMAGERKVGGLLVELAGTLEAPRFFLLGLGVNLRAVPLSDRASSGLAELMGEPPLRRELAAAFQTHMTAWADRPTLRPEAWARHCAQIGANVSVQDWRGKSLSGIARGFDARGGLILATSRSETTLLPGEVRRIRLSGAARTHGDAE
jgi:BirA family transcriptional regulator, biotin operon repressor / biotin---[acetyl-CoA-carboxylase] ligase